MPFDPTLRDRIEALLKRKRGVSSRRMFGGVCYLVNGNMAFGVEGVRLVVRVGPTDYDTALKLRHARPMDFTGRPLRGFVYVQPAELTSVGSLRSWIERGIRFAESLPKKDPQAKTTKRRSRPQI
jgi:TfoX/Sxy family transcriptional regulator of competence genes